MPALPRRGVECRTGADFVRILADPGVDTAYLPGDVALKEEDFADYNTTIIIRRNFTIAGVASRQVTLDLGFLKGKVDAAL